MGNQISKRTAVGEHTFRLHYPLGPTSNGTLWKVFFFIESILLNQFEIIVFFFLLFFVFQGGYRDGKDEFAIKVVPAKTVAVEKIFDNLLIEREIMISVGSKFIFLFLVFFFIPLPFAKKKKTNSTKLDRNPFIAPLYYSFSSPTAFYFVMPKQTTGLFLLTFFESTKHLVCV